MKTFRVTLKYILNSHTIFLSTTIPAYNETLAIDNVIEANGLAGRVLYDRAEEVN